MIIGPVAGIKGRYEFIGLLIALIVYNLSSSTTTKERSLSGFKSYGRPLRTSVYFITLLFLIVVAGVPLVSDIGASVGRTFVLLLVLTVGYGIVMIQTYEKSSPKHILPQVLFADYLIPICVAVEVTMLGPIHRYSVYCYFQSLQWP